MKAAASVLPFTPMETGTRLPPPPVDAVMANLHALRLLCPVTYGRFADLVAFAVKEAEKFDEEDGDDAVPNFNVTDAQVKEIADRIFNDLKREGLL